MLRAKVNLHCVTPPLTKEKGLIFLDDLQLVTRP